MSTPTTLERPTPALLEWLASHDIEHEIHAHSPTFTARATARAEGVDPRTFAKVVGVASQDGRRHLVVLDAPDHLDLHKARGVIGTGDVRLLTEAELAALAPDCQAGAIPAVGVAVRSGDLRRLRRAGGPGHQLQRRQPLLQRSCRPDDLGTGVRGHLRRSCLGERQPARVGPLLSRQLRLPA